MRPAWIFFYLHSWAAMLSGGELTGSMHGQLSVFSDHWKAEISPCKRKVVDANTIHFTAFIENTQLPTLSQWYCLYGINFSLALEFLSQYWLLSEGVDFICIFGGRSSKTYYKKCQLLTLSSSWALRTLVSFERLLSACSNMSQVNAVNLNSWWCPGLACLQGNEITSFRGWACLEMMQHWSVCYW